MRLRIRLGTGRPLQRKTGKNSQLAAAAAGLLSPLALLAATVAVWRICADLGVVNAFAIASGFFSHWQVWALLAIGLQAGAVLLNHYSDRYAPAPLPHDTDPVIFGQSTRKPSSPLE
jgi:hypothetical protein